MALGKRKRRDQIESEESSPDTVAGDTSAHLQIWFKKHFEAKFKPLEGVSSPANAVQLPTAPSDKPTSDWEGLSDVSDDETMGGPVVVQHNVPHRVEDAFNKDESKAFMAWTLSQRRLAKLIVVDLLDC